MKQYALTRQNEYVIKTIARELPAISLASLNPNRKTYHKRVYQFFDWLFNIHWPNGDAFISQKIVVWVRKKYFGVNDHNWNHERRLRKAYLNNGIMGVIAYLIKIGTDQKYIAQWIGDIKFTGDDLQQIRKIEQHKGIKLIK